MLTEKMNSILTDVTGGSPMHDTLSRYWLPALLSRDLPTPDSDPIPVTILGKKLVAFRDTAGVVGVLNEHCCHRSTSLCLGRVEEGGIRCLYHGWKFATDGRALELPNVDDKRLLEKVRQPAYPVEEAGGIVWVYLGPQDKKPPLPDEGFFHVPPENVFIEVLAFPANFTRTLEGVIDNSHVGILHKDSAPADALTDFAPRLETQETEFGFRYAVLRKQTDEQGEPYLAARITAFSLPSNVYMTADRRMLTDEARDIFITRSDRRTVFRSVAYDVPIHNDLTYHYVVWWDPDHAIGVGEEAQRFRMYFGLEPKELDRTGMSRQGLGATDARDNYGQNRDAMRRGETFSGLYPFFQEDWAVVASMGAIKDRPAETLLHSDSAVGLYRKILIDNALAVQAGKDPRGLTPQQRPYSIAATLSPGDDWRDFFTENREAEMGRKVDLAPRAPSDLEPVGD